MRDTYYARVRVVTTEDWYVEADSVEEAREKLEKGDICDSSPGETTDWEIVGDIKTND